MYQQNGMIDHCIQEIGSTIHVCPNPNILLSKSHENMDMETLELKKVPDGLHQLDEMNMKSSFLFCQETA